MGNEGSHHRGANHQKKFDCRETCDPSRPLNKHQDYHYAGYGAPAVSVSTALLPQSQQDAISRNASQSHDGQGYNMDPSYKQTPY